MESAVAAIAAAIGEPARARILYSLMDGRARTGTELAVVAEVSSSTASAHMKRLQTAGLVQVFAQGRHRYYSLRSRHVAGVLEGLGVLAGRPRGNFTPNTPKRLCAARTCYDHIAGALGVALHDHFRNLKWLAAYDLTREGVTAFTSLGLDLVAMRALRRNFASPCLDWSERRPHLGGALGAGVLKLALKRKWVIQDLDSRALEVPAAGRREIRNCLGLVL